MVKLKGHQLISLVLENRKLVDGELSEEVAVYGFGGGCVVSHPQHLTISQTRHTLHIIN